jgi:histidinol-phosphatase
VIHPLIMVPPENPGRGGRESRYVPLVTAADALTRDLELAMRMADAADDLSMGTFTGQPLEFEEKPDGSPVTDTDRAIEERLRSMVVSERPGDGFLGEEVGASGPTSRRWIVDGIDGTVVYVAGGTGWSTQIALVVDGIPVVGVSTSPALRTRWSGVKGRGAWAAHDGADRVPIGVSGRDELTGATFSAIPPLDRLRATDVTRLEPLVASGRYVPPLAHAAILVAGGDAEVAYQSSGGPWDFAALAVIVEAAGGRFSDLDGAPDIECGGPVVFTNRLVHDDVLRALDRTV